MVKNSFTTFFIILFVILAYFIVQGGYEKEEVYTCENPEVDSRAYVFLRGFGDHGEDAFSYQESLLDDEAILDFDYDETALLETISDDFVAQFTAFVAEQDVEEIIILGQSAGGVIASAAAHQLVFEGSIELHTMASPLNGYHVSEEYLTEQVGFGREIGEGFTSFPTPPKNMIVYHHKTVEDEPFLSRCGENIELCDAVEIQNNNLEGSQEFFYPEETHDSIMETVSELVISCHK